MLDEKNELTVIASNSATNKFILATPMGLSTNKMIAPQDGQFEKFAFVTDIVRGAVIEMMRKTGKAVASNDCMLSGALGMAMCHINNFKKLQSRILVVSCSMLVSSYASQYMNLMNSFFAAQKMNIPIDGCVYMKDDTKRCSILEQGCDLTRGHYLNLPDLAGNLEYLLWIFLPSQTTREDLLLPERRKATTRAACFCHRNIIDVGYVCSVCLSIFCTYSPICTSCQTHFKLNVPTKIINRLSAANNSSQQPSAVQSGQRATTQAKA